LIRPMMPSHGITTFTRPEIAFSVDPHSYALPSDRALRCECIHHSHTNDKLLLSWRLAPLLIKKNRITQDASAFRPKRQTRPLPYLFFNNGHYPPGATTRDRFFQIRQRPTRLTRSLAITSSSSGHGQCDGLGQMVSQITKRLSCKPGLLSNNLGVGIVKCLYVTTRKRTMITIALIVVYAQGQRPSRALIIETIGWDRWRTIGNMPYNENNNTSTRKGLGILPSPILKKSQCISLTGGLPISPALTWIAIALSLVMARREEPYHHASGPSGRGFPICTPREIYQ